MHPEKNITPCIGCRIRHISDHDYYLCESTNNSRYECPFLQTHAFCIYPNRDKIPCMGDKNRANQ